MATYSCRDRLARKQNCDDSSLGRIKYMRGQLGKQSLVSGFLKGSWDVNEKSFTKKLYVKMTRSKLERHGCH